MTSSPTENGLIFLWLFSGIVSARQYPSEQSHLSCRAWRPRCMTKVTTKTSLRSTPFLHKPSWVFAGTGAENTGWDATRTCRTSLRILLTNPQTKPPRLQRHKTHRSLRSQPGTGTSAYIRDSKSWASLRRWNGSEPTWAAWWRCTTTTTTWLESWRGPAWWASCSIPHILHANKLGTASNLRHNPTCSIFLVFGESWLEDCWRTTSSTIPTQQN